MINSSKIKWIGSIILAGTLLVLALLGGNWGTDYSASAGVNLTPYIESIVPSAVPAGSPYIIMIISGSFIDQSTNDTRVRLTAAGFDDVFEPLQVLPDGISVVIPADLLIEPIVYTVTVVWSTVGTIPEPPPNPIYDEESNPVPFTVFSPFTYLPIITISPNR